MEQENFLHDEELRDLEEITNTAESGEVIVVNGVWGFGKTKLIEKFKEKRNEQCLSINLWNSGFEKNVLYYFYKEISENENKEKNTFLKFYRWNIITVPIWFVISTFLLVNYFLPLLHKIISDNNSCIYIILLLIGIGVLTVVLYMIGYYIKRNIAKYIVFKKDFNSFFHEYFVSEIIKLAKKQNIQYVIVEDVDRLQRETIRELTTVIDSLKQNQEIKFKFIVSFNALKLLVPDEKDKQPEYYFDKVENHRVNMGGVVEKSQKLFYSQLGHHPEIKNHNNFDRKVLGESFQYFENVISLRFIEKFVTWYERQRGMENNRDKHPANMFVDFYLQQKQGMTEDEFIEKYSESIPSVITRQMKKNPPETTLMDYLNDFSFQTSDKLFNISKSENNVIGKNFEFTTLMSLIFLDNDLPFYNPVYNYSIDIGDSYTQYAFITNLNDRKLIRTKKQLMEFLIQQKKSVFFETVAEYFLSKNLIKFREYADSQRELLQSVVNIIIPLKNIEEVFIEIMYEIPLSIKTSGTIFSLLNSGKWFIFDTEVKFRNSKGSAEKTLIKIAEELQSLMKYKGSEYTENIDIIKWFILLYMYKNNFLSEISTEFIMVERYIEGFQKYEFYDVFLDLEAGILVNQT